MPKKYENDDTTYHYYDTDHNCKYKYGDGIDEGDDINFVVDIIVAVVFSYASSSTLYPCELVSELVIVF